MRRGIGCFLLILLSACRTAPEAIVVGEDHCGRCQMQIADERFAAEVITDKGRVLKFDSISCLVGFVNEGGPKPSEVLVSDFLRAGSLVPVEKAFFLHVKDLNGPMGPAVVASADEPGLRKLGQEKKGELVRWEDLLRSAH